MLHVAACVHPLLQCNQLAPHAPSLPASAAVPLPLPLLLVLPQVEQLQKKLATPSYQEKTPEEVKAAGEPLGAEAVLLRGKAACGRQRGQVWVAGRRRLLFCDDQRARPAYQAALWVRRRARAAAPGAAEEWHWPPPGSHL